MQSPKNLGFRVFSDSSEKFLDRETEESGACGIRKGSVCVNDTLIDPPYMLASLTEGAEKCWERKMQ